MLNGIFLPVTTPFQPQTFAPDAEAFTTNLRKWAEHPIAGVVVGGSTGEAPLLELEELARLVDLGRSALPESILLVAGTGRESTRGTVSACQMVAERGAEAVLVRPPSYFRAQMTPEALREHFLEVADRSPVPVILYHVPKFVPVEIVPELAGELVRHDNIAGIKDSSADIHNLGALCESVGERGTVVVGAGTLLYPGLEIGARGGIIAVGLLATGASCELYRTFVAGRSAEAGRLQERIGPLHKKVVAGTGVPGVKHGLDLLGLAGGPPRPPLLPPTDREREEVAKALERAGLAAGSPQGV